MNRIPGAFFLLAAACLLPANPALPCDFALPRNHVHSCNSALPAPVHPPLPFSACRLRLEACSLQLPSPGDSTGIEGMVFSPSGNQMPSPHRKPGARKGIRSTIYIFMLTGSDQVTRLDGSPYYYSAIKTRMVRQADTDSNGYFNLLLPAGTYSIFTKKGDLFYASRRDDKNNIAPVEVRSGKMTKVDCRVESDHKAFY
jgi:hypothetical protein